MSVHKLVVTFQDAGWGPDIKLACPDDGSCPPVLDLADWDDETTCRCDDADCPCRETEHHECVHFGPVEETGPGCRCKPIEPCWWQSTLETCGTEGWKYDPPLVLEVDVTLEGCSWNDPTIVSAVIPPRSAS